MLVFFINTIFVWTWIYSLSLIYSFDEDSRRVLAIVVFKIIEILKTMPSNFIVELKSWELYISDNWWNIFLRKTIDNKQKSFIFIILFVLMTDGWQKRKVRVHVVCIKVVLFVWKMIWSSIECVRCRYMLCSNWMYNLDDNSFYHLNVYLLSYMSIDHGYNIYIRAISHLFFNNKMCQERYIVLLSFDSNQFNWSLRKI